MQTKEFLNTVCEQIKYKPIRNSISEELKNHIEDRKEELIEMGQNEEEAEKNAVEQMGDAEIIGKELNKVHRPRLDWKLLIILVVLLIFGFVISYIITEKGKGILKEKKEEWKIFSNGINHVLGGVSFAN